MEVVHPAGDFQVHEKTHGRVFQNVPPVPLFEPSRAAVMLKFYNARFLSCDGERHADIFVVNCTSTLLEYKK